jgi:RNA polymerase sigma-70 factor (ECF subfamily)
LEKHVQLPELPGNAREKLANSYRRCIVATVGEPLPQPASPLCFDTETGGHEDELSDFVNVRHRLFGIAYQILGCAAQAEDIVQDVWLRWQSTDRSTVENAPAFLATTTARLCINLARSARSRRESYVGSWFLEPVDNSADPEMIVERDEALSVAALVLLEKLSPTERAAYVLRKAFDYSYREIADVLQVEEANTRQLVSRARKHIADGRRIHINSGEQRRFLNAFIDAAQDGNMRVLEDLLVADIDSYSADDEFLRDPRRSFWPQSVGEIGQGLST